MGRFRVSMFSKNRGTTSRPRHHPQMGKQGWGKLIKKKSGKWASEATMLQDISDHEDFYKDSSNKHQKSSGNKLFCELLSLSDFQGLAATTPSGRDNKNGWYNIHQKHINLSLNSKMILVLIGDSIVAGLSHYTNTWQTFFKTFHALNYGIGGDHMQYVLWHADSSKFFEICSYTLWY